MFRARREVFHLKNNARDARVGAALQVPDRIDSKGNEFDSRSNGDLAPVTHRTGHKVAPLWCTQASVVAHQCPRSARRSYESMGYAAGRPRPSGPWLASTLQSLQTAGRTLHIYI
jgi:hypothetical protein